MDDVADVHGEAELKDPHRQDRQQRADEDELDGARPGVVAEVRGDPGTRTGDETGQPGQGMDATMVLSGTVCLSTAVPGLADYQAFYKAAADSDFIFSNPAVAKSPTGAAQAKAYATLTRKMAEAGMALESHVTISATGDNPMAQMMAKLAASDITTTVTKIETGDQPADRFDIPAGYKVKTQK